MRIKRLIVSKYKNVEKLNLKFDNHLISLLVGKNGLGKSNLIEILALIFRDLEQNNSERDFRDYWESRAGYFEYYIHYECKNSEIKLLNNSRGFNASRKQRGTQDPFVDLTFADFKRRRMDYLPDFIIGYYSGENKRIKEILTDYEITIWNQLKKNEGLDKTFRKLFFGENHHAQALLLTLLLYKGQTHNEQFRAKIGSLVEQYCSFGDLEKVTIVLRQPEWFRPRNKAHEIRSIENLEQNLLSESRIEFPFWGIKGKADKIITYFYNNSESINSYYDEDEKIEKLVFSNIDQTALAAGVYEKFGHPLNFFDAMEALQQINAIHTLSLTVKSKYGNVKFDFKELSEGEQQLITVLGLVLIAGRDDCLFLLDEPDTHLNPIWQRDYVQLLRDFNLNDDNSHIVAATHSPLIVQAAEDTDIFLYKQNKDSGKISIDGNEEMKIHNWRIDQVLASEYFGFENTRPPKLDRFMEERERLLSKPELSEEDIARIKSFEEDDDLLPSGETLNDFLAMHLIHKTANRIRQNGAHQ